ncbi:M23 family metallopeptidase [Virgibacillus sp. C22-A2]|uniref:M23 family metallopeptidase n=1 Tax=Virgibacillus tibetensis TaxID=3042313 RepID=A0ABU6KJ03_9BACI|nr:M23 family metallopeptidase [Virgibacillus sp. C22-A2]
MFKGWKSNYSNVERSSLFKKVIAVLCIGFFLPISTVYAEEESIELESVYHVYIDEKYIGQVDDTEVIDRVIDQKLSAQSDKYKDINITIGQDVSVISESVFNPKSNNTKVRKALEEQLTVMANAVELVIGKDTVGYFSDRESAEEVVSAYKTKYVDNKILEKMEAAEEKKMEMNSSVIEDGPKKKNKVIPAIDETIIKGVELSDEVSFSEQKVLPEEVLHVEQGIKMLEKGTLSEEVHQVSEGEVIGGIASKYNLSTEKLLELNQDLDEDSLLQIGQEINVTEYKPFVDVIVREEMMVEETISYETEIIESDDLYKGDKEVKQEGKDGQMEVHYAIEKRNGKQTGKEKLTENITKEAVNEVIIKGTKVISSRGTGEMAWPAVGGYISSHVGERWGRMHKGIDIARPSNSTIKAADNGTIEYAGYDNGGYGNKIVINHNNGMKTIYAHLASISVSPGQTVEKGSKIGVMGSTGNSTGVHLHFEVYKNGSLKNPVDYLN